MRAHWQRGVMTLAAIAAAAILATGDEGDQHMTGSIQVYSVEAGALVDSERVVKEDSEWRRLLTPEQFRIARGHGTERACTRSERESAAEGVYRCVACGNDLFLSTAKFVSGSGWPSFFEPVHEANVGTSVDRALGMVRTEVHCSRCDAHLGHVFDDGPRPTGLRYCINGAVLELAPMDLDGDGKVAR